MFIHLEEKNTILHSYITFCENILNIYFTIRRILRKLQNIVQLFVIFRIGYAFTSAYAGIRYSQQAK